MPRTKRAVLLLIDVEPDARKTRGDPGGWEGSTAALPHLERFRRQVEDRTGVRAEFNWFLRADPQIQKSWGRSDWVAEACPGVLGTIEDRGDHCGIHPHLWRWDARRARWFNDLNDREWTAECLHTAIDAYQRVFHRPPDSCRFGDRWLDQHAVELMDASGIHYDLTIEPGLPDAPIADDRHATGWLPDYRSAPREPYHPSAENFLVPGRAASGSGSLCMVPLTTTTPFWRLVRRPPYLLWASRTPNLSLRSSYVWPHLRTQLDLDTKVPLTIVVRSADLRRRRFLRNFLRTTRQLVNHPGLARCEFTNPAAAVARWHASR